MGLEISGGRLWIPGNPESIPRIECSRIQPLSFLQAMFNRIYYMRDDSPLGIMGTLGSSDPLLARAKAADFLQNCKGKVKTVHEIGPGNFNFAKNFVDAVKPEISDLAYHGHDFSESSFMFVEGELAQKYNGTISFHNRSIEDFAESVDDDPLHVVLVEVLDDTRTEFFTVHEGIEYLCCGRPKMRQDVRINSRVRHAKMLIERGDFSLAVQRMACVPGNDKEYTAAEMVELLDNADWKELEKIHPSFLQWFEDVNKQFMPFEVEDVVYKYHWQNPSPEFKEFTDEVVSYFRQQMRRTGEDIVIHIPVAGIDFLWGLKKKADKGHSVHADFFDYGYSSSEEKLNPIMNYNGQITSPVNFELMVHAAESLGFNVQLEKNEEYINRMLGEDTVVIGRMRDAFPHWSNENAEEFFYAAFEHAVKKLCPDVKCTPENISQLRVRREDYEKMIYAAKEGRLADPNFKLPEGSYHMAVEK